MLLTEHDIYLFREGTHGRAYEKLGAHLLPAHAGRAAGTYFAVWAPNAASVAVIGDFNAWDPLAHPLVPRPDSSGIWDAFVPGLGAGTLYKYHIVSHQQGYTVDKSDPFAFRCETPPRTASVVCDLGYEWGDEQWLHERAQ
ncbi:MAG: 1,4-alpha-glucan branching enzyme, partial [Pseudomonadota bacterium]|nr:1,4-alpha-glucan branching enzyme [Pseudomonadota bacterium]